MESISAGHSQHSSEADATPVVAYPFEGWDSDDNFGDEVAFPGTWQRLAAGDIAHD